MKRVNQTGSIGVFVVVGAILVAISLAVLYGIRQNNLSQDGSPISSDLVASENNNKNSQNNSTSQQSADQKTNNQSGGRGEARTDVKTEESKKTTPTPESSQSQQSPSSTTPAPSTPSSKQSDKGLPKTGPEDVAVSAVAFGILAFLAVAYQRSRYLI
jgi:archaellum component FlaD/FlaE